MIQIIISIIYFLILITPVISILIFVYYKNAYQYWKRISIPFLEPSIPYGNVADLVKEKINFGEKFAEIYKQGKEISNTCVGIFFLSQPVLIPIDPELIKSILTKDFTKFHGRGMYHNENIDPLSGNLVRINGDKWKRIRTKLSPVFTSGKIKNMFTMLLHCTNQMKSVIATNLDNPIEFKDLFEKLGTDVIGSCVFGINCNSFKEPNTEFRKHANLFFESTMTDAWKFMASQKFPFIFDLFRIPLIRPEVTRFFTEIFKNTVDYRLKTGHQRKDFIDLFMKVKNNEDLQDGKDSNSSGDITYNELTAQAFAFFVAGLETSSSTMHFCLFELAQNFEIQDKLRKEIIEILEKHNDEICYEAIMEMKYLDQTICETLRKYPPIPILNRECEKDYYTPEGKLLVKKGNKVWIPLLGLHNDPEHFPNPEKFNPERFSEEEKLKRHPFAYLPFGEGPRICIGMRFGLLEVKVGLVSLLRSYKFKINQQTQIPCRFAAKGIFLSFQNKVYFDVEPLDQKSYLIRNLK